MAFESGTMVKLPCLQDLAPTMATNPPDQPKLVENAFGAPGLAHFARVFPRSRLNKRDRADSDTATHKPCDEILEYLGRCERIVGLDRFVMWWHFVAIHLAVDQTFHKHVGDPNDAENIVLR